MMEFDKFLPEDIYEKLKAYALSCDFAGIENPIDGVFYPDINIDIPEDIKNHVKWKISTVTGVEPKDDLMFLRMSKRGVFCPHIHHHDRSHGKYSLMLYLNTHDEGGTSLVRHKATGCTYAPEDPDCILDDTNNVDKWTAYHNPGMNENTAVLFDAGLMHRAESVGGFGETQEEARIVLTCFFND